MAYSKGFTERAVACRREGHAFEQLREAFGIPPATYYDWGEKLENGHFDVKVRRGRRRKIDKEAPRQSVMEKPDAFLSEYAEEFDCTPAATFYALEKLNISRKKSPLPIMKNRKRSGTGI